MKACNFASLDPALHQRGLSGASRADHRIWQEFNGNSEQLAAEAEEAHEQLMIDTPVHDQDPLPVLPGDTEIERTVRARRVQSFFRQAVLTSYNGTCAITGIALPELLIASHIIPWSVSVERRADPTNGLCLNALLDKAFDRGLMTIDHKHRVVVSKQLRSAAAASELPSSLDRIDGRTITMPSRCHPDPQALRYHREVVFQG